MPFTVLTFYTFLQVNDLREVWGALLQTLATGFALLFFAQFARTVSCPYSVSRASRNDVDDSNSGIVQDTTQNGVVFVSFQQQRSTEQHSGSFEVLA